MFYINIILHFHVKYDLDQIAPQVFVGTLYMMEHVKA